MTMSADTAEMLAAKALLWLAQDPDHLGGFLAMSGSSADALRAEAKDPAFLGAVLDYILQADETVLAFAEAEGIAPETVGIARQSLPGGALPNWT